MKCLINIDRSYTNCVSSGHLRHWPMAVSTYTPVRKALLFHPVPAPISHLVVAQVKLPELWTALNMADFLNVVVI